MNHIETIQYLASLNSVRLVPKREEDVKKNLPYFGIRKNDMGRYEVAGFGHHGHDNEPRMPYWLQYLSTSVLPLIDRSVDVSGFYNIELHDSYTYLDNGKDYKGVMTFAKFKSDQHPVLIPDPYMIGNYGNTLQFEDRIPFETKMNKVCFYGTTTGKRDPRLNERIQTCLWASEKRDACDFYITKVAQMSMQDILTAVPNFQQITSQPVSVQDQLRYKYHAILDGNTCRYDIWSLKTCSLNLKFDSKDMLWYYPALQHNTHYVGVNKGNIIDTMNYYNNNQNDAKRIVKNAQEFVSTYIKSINHQMYMKYLLEYAADNK